MLSREPSAYMFLNKTRGTPHLQMLGCHLCVLGCVWAPTASSVGFVGTGGAVHGSAQQSPEEKSQRCWACKENTSAARSVLHPWRQISADPSSHRTAPHLLESFHSSILVANPEWLKSSRNPSKHKHGRILLVTLCHKKSVNLCVYEFLHHLFPFLQYRVRFLSPLLSSKQVRVMLMSATT